MGERSGSAETSVRDFVLPATSPHSDAALLNDHVPRDVGQPRLRLEGIGQQQGLGVNGDADEARHVGDGEADRAHARAPICLGQTCG